MMRRFALLAILAVCIGRFLPAQAFEIAVSPARFELRIDDKRRSEAIEIVNTADREMVVNVEVAHFDLDEDNKVRVIPPTEQSLDQWIAINPLSVIVPPKGRRTLRFAVRPQVQPAPGEHRAVIFLNEGQSKLAANGARLKFRIGVVVYGQVGPYDRAAVLHGLRADGAALSLDIEATGNAHARFRGAYAIWPADRYPGDAAAEAALRRAREDAGPRRTLAVPGAVDAGTLTETPVLPGTRRNIRQPVAALAATGPRRVFFLGKLGDTAIARSFGLP